MDGGPVRAFSSGPKWRNTRAVRSGTTTCMSATVPLRFIFAGVPLCPFCSEEVTSFCLLAPPPIATKVVGLCPPILADLVVCRVTSSHCLFYTICSHQMACV
jgi:hypothetical protein